MTTIRKLASVQRIKVLEPVMGFDKDRNPMVADNILLARFEDIAWQCVVKKDEGIRAGDLVVYIEIATRVSTSNPVFSFLAKNDYRVNTVTFLKTAISQGLCMPLSVFNIDPSSVKVGDDLSERLGVTRTDTDSTFPVYVPKTEETRIQSDPRLLQEAYGHHMVATLKCDGESGSWGEVDHNYVVCSHKSLIVNPDDQVGSRFISIGKMYGLDGVLHKLAKTHGDIVIQGEVVGPGIRKNRMGLQKLELRIFTIHDVAKGSMGRWTYKAIKDFCEAEGLPVVPVVQDLPNFGLNVEEIIALAAVGNNPGTSFPREGIVVRPWDEALFSQILAGPLSFKVVSNKYLLKGGD